MDIICTVLLPVIIICSMLLVNEQGSFIDRIYRTMIGQSRIKNMVFSHNKYVEKVCRDVSRVGIV